jgi:nucleoside-diphosphate-sugar epimerase
VPRGVYTSTLAVFSDTHGRLVDESYRHDGPWLSAYDRTKWVAHYIVAEPFMRAGLPLVIVQPGAVYGPGDTSALGRTLVQYLRRQLPVVPGGAAFCWGHVDDTARAHLLAMERGRPGESYIIAGPPHTLAETLDLAHRLTGVPPPRLRLPAPAFRVLMMLAQAAEPVVTLPEAYTAEALQVAAGVTYLGRSAKAERELGFTARPLEVGLRETLLYEMARLGLPARAGS